MSCTAELRRRYPRLSDAWSYLEARGFTCTGSGWVNGRWAAAVEPGDDGVEVIVWLRLRKTERAA